MPLKNQLNLFEEERPLQHLPYGRNVHKDQHWQNQTHLHKWIQEGAQGDEIANFIIFFSCIGWGGGSIPCLAFWLKIFNVLSPQLVSCKTFKKLSKCPFYTFLLQSPDQRASYRSRQYREAMTKEDQCKVPLDGLENWSTEKMRKEYDEYCPKSKSNNIILCPQKIIHQPINKVQWINDYFKNLGKKTKKKKTKKKGKERRNKKKLIKRRGSQRKHIN